MFISVRGVGFILRVSQDFVWAVSLTCWVAEPLEIGEIEIGPNNVKKEPYSLSIQNLNLLLHKNIYASLEAEKKMKKLTIGEKKCVRRWLRMKLYNDCPFEGTPEVYKHRICMSWFPKGREMNTCPCTEYPLETVKKYARRMIKS